MARTGKLKSGAGISKRFEDWPDSPGSTNRQGQVDGQPVVTEHDLSIVEFISVATTGLRWRGRQLCREGVGHLRSVEQPNCVWMRDFFGSVAAVVFDARICASLQQSLYEFGTQGVLRRNVKSGGAASILQRWRRSSLQEESNRVKMPSAGRLVQRCAGRVVLRVEERQGAQENAQNGLAVKQRAQVKRMAAVGVLSVNVSPRLEQCFDDFTIATPDRKV